jgi:hypothetical protein
MDLLSWMTIEIFIAMLVGGLVLLFIAGKVWRLVHNRYFWLVALLVTGAVMFALYDVGNRQTFFKWLGITESYLGLAYTGGQTFWQDYGDRITNGWNMFIGFFVAHPSIGYVVLLCLAGIIFSTMGLIVIARFGAQGMRYIRKKVMYWGLKSLLVSAITVLLIELNFILINPEITAAIKGMIITQVGAIVFSSTLKDMLKGAIASMIYREEY